MICNLPRHSIGVIVMTAVVALSSLVAPREAKALTRDEVKLIVKAARAKLGTPYQYGGSDWKKGVDCSFLTQYCYAQAGFSISRTSAAQVNDCKINSVASGSLVFFATDPARPGVVTHVGISLGDGTMISANSYANKVSIDDFTDKYWKPKFLYSKTVR